MTANIQTFIKNEILPIVFRKIYQGFKRNWMYKCWAKCIFANIYFYIKCFNYSLLLIFLYQKNINKNIFQAHSVILIISNFDLIYLRSLFVVLCSIMMAAFGRNQRKTKY